MTLGGFELTPWERRREWYSNIELGKDIKTQTVLLEKQTKAMVVAQAAGSSTIVASQERIREGVDALAYRIDEIREGMHGLKAAFEFGISEVVWQIEQNRQVLKNILEVLMAPLDTQAKELKRRAEDAYANGWFEEALEDLLESEKKNRYDFSVHISIGVIYLFRKGDRKQAFNYFEKAVKYAKPKSVYHASFALLHAALIKRDLNLLEEAEELSATAVALTPDFAEALYQNALYNALLNRPNRAIPCLKAAIQMDVNYCEKAHSDGAFAPIASYVEQLFAELRDSLGKSVVAEHTLVLEKQAKLIEVIARLPHHELSTTTLNP